MLAVAPKLFHQNQILNILFPPVVVFPVPYDLNIGELQPSEIKVVFGVPDNPSSLIGFLFLYSWYPCGQCQHWETGLQTRLRPSAAETAVRMKSMFADGGCP